MTMLDRERDGMPGAAPVNPSMTRAPRILVLEDQAEIRSLIVAMLSIRGLTCDAAGSLAEARALLRDRPYDLFFLDVNLPDGCGLTLAEESPHPALTVVITGCNDIAVAVQAIRDGAIDYITKPFSVGDFLHRLDKILEEWQSRFALQYYARALENLVQVKGEELSRTSRQMDEICDMTVAALGAALNLKDHETSDHCTRVSRNSIVLGEALSLSGFELKNLKWGAYLHDVGKIGIPESILLKPTELTEEERSIVQKHPVMGFTMLRGIKFLSYATDVVLSHHERFDGSGYPSGLRGTDIPLHARIFAVAATMDAMTSERPYRPALPVAKAIQELEEGAGKQFDPEIVALALGTPVSTWLTQGRMSMAIKAGQ